jgi:hypothetical protein
MLLLTGIIAGTFAGILMGAVSDLGYRTGIFRSSLVLIDGLFFLHVIKAKAGMRRMYIFGAPIHLFTSALFGGVYILIVNLLQLNLTSVLVIFLYIFFLWLSMLFVALPIAGLGFLGKRIGSLTWLEQLVFHLFFGIGFLGALKIL